MKKLFFQLKSINPIIITAFVFVSLLFVACGKEPVPGPNEPQDKTEIEVNPGQEDGGGLEGNGLRFEITSWEEKTASVVGTSSEIDRENYSGGFDIPYYINYEGIKYTVTSIGGDAFRECVHLTSVIIPDSVVSIGVRAFAFCSSLTSMVVPDSVKSLEKNIFCYCTGLSSVTIGNSVSSIVYGTFAYCENLTSITIPDSVTSIGDCAFYDCSSLTSVTIGNSVTSIGKETFYYCSSLTSITIPDSVVSIGYGTFVGCSSLTAVTMGNSVVSIGDEAFYSCKNLTSITIPDSVVSIGYKTFFGCSSLTSITIPGSVTSIGYGAFGWCDNLQTFYGKFVSEDNRCLILDGVLVAFAPAGLTSYSIPDLVTSIKRLAFSFCKSLTSVTIPGSVTSIDYDAFLGCSSLTSVTIPDSVVSIGDDAFRGCYGLRAFYGKFASQDNRCLIVEGVLKSFAPSRLTSYSIQNSVTSIGRSTFYNCSGLTSVTIPDSVTSIGAIAFSGCLDLRTVYCKPVLPPTLDLNRDYYDTFYNTPSNMKIYVPTESVDAYKSAEGWNEYASQIVGYNF